MRVALTGGIATGKSVVGRALADAGVATIDADVVAREVVAAGSEGLDAVVARFGAGLRRTDGSLDRAALAQLVFADPGARADLERLLHPRIRAVIDAFFAGLPRGLAAVAEIPLAYETGWAVTFDAVVVVACPADTQRERLMARDGLTRADADRRLAAQWPIADKVRLADAVVMTDGDMASTRRQSARLAAWLRDRCHPS